MAYVLIGKHGVGNYNHDTYMLDTDEDVKDLPAENPASSAISAASGKYYIVNASGKWVEFGGGE